MKLKFNKYHFIFKIFYLFIIFILIVFFIKRIFSFKEEFLGVKTKKIGLGSLNKLKSSQKRSASSFYKTSKKEWTYRKV